MARCLSTYVELGDEGYSSGALRRLSDRRKFPHQLAFDRGDVMEIRAKSVTEMSISGVQEKISLRLKRGELEPVTEGGEYILKPVPGQQLPRFLSEVPANESLTMQIAEQVYGIDTAANALIRLSDDELAYITRRFDRTRDGRRVAQEDFCQLMERTPEIDGRNYKYDASYEELGAALERYVAAYPVQIEKLFELIVFNYAVANGDAHLKNFSLQRQDEFGDYVLTPAYDLVCTKLHLPEEPRLALDLFADGEFSMGEKTHGFVTGGDFLELANRFGMVQGRAERVVERMTANHDEARDLVSRSFLSDEAKDIYLDILEDRRAALALR
ncbi:MAG: HipA domain-containing protein [Myxococcota bacterium]